MTQEQSQNLFTANSTVCSVTCDPCFSISILSCQQSDQTTAIVIQINLTFSDINVTGNTHNFSLQYNGYLNVKTYRLSTKFGCTRITDNDLQMEFEGKKTDID